MNPHVTTSANSSHCPDWSIVAEAKLVFSRSERWGSGPIRPVDPRDGLITWTVGEPMLPRTFVWRQKTIILERCLDKWKESAAAGGGERYVRKYWYRVRLVDGGVAWLNCLRQPERRWKSACRWRLFCLEDPLS